MTNFTTPSMVEMTVYQMRLGDWPRAENRARINDLFNGVAPYSNETAKQLRNSVNVNFLEATKLGHDARQQFANAFMKPGNFFSVRVDRGPKHKRHQFNAIITREINKRMKQSLPYFECKRSKFANVVLHGIGPSVWQDRWAWCPKPKGVEDILMPSNTTLTMDNVPFFAVFMPMTALELHRMTTGPRVDPGWNIPYVERLIKWADEQIFDYGLPYSDIYSPEKMSERLKSDAGLYSTDAVPTIDCWDFYFYNDTNKVGGWNRRVVLDANWEGLGVGGFGNEAPEKKSRFETKSGIHGEFVFDPGDRKYADTLSELIHFQFGDLSAVAPFRYHSVRSLGFLLYAVCHLQNRLRCKFSDSMFESMLQYFRVKNSDENERALKVNLIDKGVIDESIQFIPQSERWQVPAQLLQFGLGQNQYLINQHAGFLSQRFDYGEKDQRQTATEIMAKIHSNTALVSSALAQAYRYEEEEYREDARRFCKTNSRDPDVKKFRLACLKAGVPEEVLHHDCWEIDPERVSGAGNKTLELAVTEQMMAIRPLLPPSSQNTVLQDRVLALTDDPDKAKSIVPDEPVKSTPSTHDAQIAIGSLMQGIQVAPVPGENNIEIVDTALMSLAILVRKAQQRGGSTPDELVGFNNVAGYIGAHIQLISQDPNEKGRVKKYGDDLGQIMNAVKAMGQQMAEKAKAQNEGGNGDLTPETKAKVLGTIIQAKTKADLSRQSHAQRTAQRHTQDSLKFMRDAERHAQELQMKRDEHLNDLQMRQVEAAANVKQNRFNAFEE